MDTKRLVTGMVLAMGVVLLYQIGINWIYKKKGWALPGTNPPATQVASETSSGAPPTTNPASTQSALASAQLKAPGLRAAANEFPAATVTLGSAADRDATYAMAVRLSATGAGVEEVVLNQFARAIKSRDRYAFEQPYDNADLTRVLGTRSLLINDVPVDLSSANWKLERSDTGSATYSLDVINDSGPVVRLRKTFVLPTIQSTEFTSRGYELGVSLSVENLTGNPVAVQSTFNGAVVPPKELNQGYDQNVLVGYNREGTVLVEHFPVESFVKDETRRDITRSPKGEFPLVWFGACSTYFNAIVRPVGDGASQIARVVAEGVDQETHPNAHHVAMVIDTKPQTLAAGATAELPLQVFFGPRQRSLLKNDYYTQALIAFDQTLVMTAGPCAFCTFPILVEGLVKLLTFFHAIVRDWGLAIILLVVLVRLVLHPITKRAQVNMMKMGKLGPQIEALKKKFGDDKDAMAKAQMQLYKEMGFTPVLGCLPMFLQMPIFIALWQSLNTTFELRHAPFLYGITWIKDLAQPDQLYVFSKPISFLFFSISAINVLPILVAIVTFLNQKYTPKPPATTPEQVQQQKMMQWMTLIFPLFFYSMPSGLNIYYLTSTGLGILEAKRIRDHIKEQEEREKLMGPVIVDAPPARKGSSKHDDKPVVKKGRFATWVANLQAQAEQVRTEQEKRKKRGT